MKIDEHRFQKYVTAICDSLNWSDRILIECQQRHKIQGAAEEQEISYGLIGGKKVVY